MKRVAKYIVLLLVFVLTACHNEEFLFPNKDRVPEGKPVMCTMSFNSSIMPEVTISTKTSLGQEDETRIVNMYVMIFDNAGNKFYGRLFDEKDKVANASDLEDSNIECWFLKSEKIDNIIYVSGAVKISTVSSSGCTIFVTCNVGLANVTIDGNSSIEQLEAIQSLEELREAKLQINDADIMSKGFLPMSGISNKFVDGSALHTGSMTYKSGDESKQVNISIKRYNAKVRFRVRATSTNISKLEPLLWSVYNVPSSSYLVGRQVADTNSDGVIDSDNFDPADGYFNTPEIFFEGVETETINEEQVTWHVFTFYMMENRRLPRQVISTDDYYLRERQDKTDLGDGYVENGDWTYANEKSTYVKFSTDLVLTKAGLAELTDKEEEEVTQVGLTTQATYTVHLGNFTSCDAENTHNFNDYNTERNHYYTYDIVINNVKSIYTEVKDHSIESQPSGIGGIVIADQEIINCDAHYENHLMAFNYLDPDDIGQRFTWYVKTPFSDGSPIRVMEGGHPKLDSNGDMTFDASGLDYKWVTFALNEIEDGEYKETRRSYPGDSSPELMDINQLINKLYSEAKKWKNESTRSTSIFYNGTSDSQRKVRVTAFINEYYYEKNPLTGETDPLLWKKFVNAPEREMHILSNAELSKDKESMIIYSSHSVVQRSIQSFYNVDSPRLHTLYGSEYMDEYEDEPWAFFSINPGFLSNEINGRLNTCYSWGLTNSAGSTWNDVSWGTFLDYAVGENVPQLNNEHTYQIYSCMVRNRDNNGDGKIDKDEVRWYLAAIDQLNGMWIGDDALAADARLYHHDDGKMHHILSSTFGNGGCKVMWAEEGNSVSHQNQSEPKMESKYPEEKWKHYSVRCLRNIGTFNDDGAIRDISYSPITQEIDNYVIVSTTGDTDANKVMHFNFENLNSKAKRAFSSGELIAADETSVINRVYQDFETMPLEANLYPDKSYITSFKNINDNITQSSTNQYCPAGYRLPNQREAAMTVRYYGTYFPNYYTNGLQTPLRTFFSFGEYGSRRNESDLGVNQGYFEMESDRTRMGGIYDGANGVRCVKDIDATATLEIRLLGSSGHEFAESVKALPEATISLQRSVYSPYSKISSEEVFLCYQAKDGRNIKTKIFEKINPGLNNDNTTWQYTLPNTDFWNTVDLNQAVKFKMTVSNSAGNVQTKELTLIVKLINVEPVEPGGDW